MNPAVPILLTVLALLIAGKILFIARRNRICFASLRSEDLPEDFLKALCPQLRETGLPAPDRETLRALSCDGSRFQEIAEKADPGAPNQAVLFIEDSGLVLISAGIAARIAGGDRRLARKIARWTESTGCAYVMIANFGLRETRRGNA